MERRNNPRILTGAFVGLLLTAPLIAIMYAANQIAGLPMVPFDLFDWVGRVLPGGVITAGIDGIIAVIGRLNLGDTDSTAKAIEQWMGIAMLLGIGIVSAEIFFTVMRNTNNRHRYLPGLIFGALVSVPLLLLISSIPTWMLNHDLVTSFIWVIALFVIWGVAHNVIYHEMTSTEVASVGGQTVVVEPLDRRRFIIGVGGAAAVITVAGAGLGAALRRSEGVSQVASLPTTTTSANPAVAAGRWSESNPLPNAGAQPEPAPGTRPEFTPVEEHYRIDINATPPRLDANTWRLKVTGMFDNPAELTLDQLMTDYTPVDAFITMSCISNNVGGDLISTQRWTGIPLRTLLEE